MGPGIPTEEDYVLYMKKHKVAFTDEGEIKGQVSRDPRDQQQTSLFHSTVRLFGIYSQPGHVQRYISTGTAAVLARTDDPSTGTTTLLLETNEHVIPTSDTAKVENSWSFSRIPLELRDVQFDDHNYTTPSRTHYLKEQHQQKCWKAVEHYVVCDMPLLS